MVRLLLFLVGTVVSTRRRPGLGLRLLVLMKPSPSRARPPRARHGGLRRRAGAPRRRFTRERPRGPPRPAMAAPAGAWDRERRALANARGRWLTSAADADRRAGPALAALSRQRGAEPGRAPRSPLQSGRSLAGTVGGVAGRAPQAGAGRCARGRQLCLPCPMRHVHISMSLKTSTTYGPDAPCPRLSAVARSPGPRRRAGRRLSPRSARATHASRMCPRESSSWLRAAWEAVDAPRRREVP